MTDHLKEYIEKEVQTIFHDKRKKLWDELCEMLPGGVANHGGSHTFYLKQKLTPADYKGEPEPGTMGIRYPNHKPNILRDCFGSIFPEVSVCHISEHCMITDFICLLSLASGHSMPTKEDRESRRELILNKIREQVMGKMMSNLPKDEAPDETIVITGKDIGVSKG